MLRERILKKSENPARPGVLDLVWGQGHLRSFMERLAMSTQSVVTHLKRKNVHRVAYMVFNEVWDVQQTLDCSHLCHNLLCVNVQHLFLEPISVNNNRNHCKNEDRCFGHPGHKDCLIYPRLVWGLKHYITPFLHVCPSACPSD